MPTTYDLAAPGFRRERFFAAFAPWLGLPEPPARRALNLVIATPPAPPPLHGAAGNPPPAPADPRGRARDPVALPRPGALRPDPDRPRPADPPPSRPRGRGERPRRHAVPDVQVPDDADAAGRGGTAGLGLPRRPPDHAPRPGAAEVPARRAPAALQRPAGPDECRGPAAGAAGDLRIAAHAGALVCHPPAHPPRDHRAGAGHAGVRPEPR